MPPKKSGAEASKKTVQKKKLQVVDDKTFGLKNKNKSKNHTGINFYLLLFRMMMMMLLSLTGRLYSGC